jgi:3-methylcrotonyl-CoA carboxylase alpha subunit
MQWVQPLSLCCRWKSLQHSSLRYHFRRIQYVVPWSVHPQQQKCLHSSSASPSLSGSASHREYLLSLPPPKNIQKVLIANRGEIACRIIRTCKRLGLSTVAIYSSVDGPNCLHAQMADEAVPIGTGPAASQSYLLMDDILQITQETQANAIHPGFGFLSENAQFAQRVRQQDLLFVGPPVSAMEDMASKSRSKHIMEQAGVPVTPGFDPYTNPNTAAVDEPSDIDELLYERALNHVGFPLIIKALMGGGGKGMRLVHTSNDFREALRSCQHEALASFGDARVLLERYLIRPRHVEVQVIADAFGNTVYLYERDCSLQRRHQKVIEEAPASDLAPSFRKRLGMMGTRAAEAVGYVNAGTVEFLLDTAPLAATSMDHEEPHPNIYFCEMNTRLQVEHPVTEQITGIDLVEWQLRVAAGETLPIPNQEDIPPINGHSMEARIYAEAPSRNFLPSPGHVWYHRPPTVPNSDTDPITGIRVDTGIQSGQDVSVFYDPMIAKLVCHGSTRQEAIQRLTNALKKYHIAGVSTNIDFLIRCAQHPTFQIAGAINTGFLEDHVNDIFNEEKSLAPSHWAPLAGIMAVLLRIEKRITPSNLNSANPIHNISSKRSNLRPWSSHWGSWRMGGESGRPQRTLNVTLPNPMEVTCISNRDGSFDINWLDSMGPFVVSGTLAANGGMEIVVSRTQRIKLTTVLKEDDGFIKVRMWPAFGTTCYSDYFWEIDVVDPVSSISNHGSTGFANTSSNGEVKAPMPGKVSRINFQVGDRVEVGDVVVVLEAMKMEHNCSSPCIGSVTEIRCEKNSVVPEGAILFVVAAEDETETTIDASES